MIKKIDPSNLELIFPPDIYLKGEDLYESKSITDIQKIERNLFSFTVKDGDKYEVEWLKPLTKNQKASCECEFFKIGKICKHAVAALIYYKNNLNAEIPVEEKQSRLSALNINGIFNNTSKEEIKSFLKSYASTDKKFATAFKVHFARKVDLVDNEKKYKSILDSVIKPVTSEKNPFKATDVRSLIEITNEFYDQAEDALAINENRESFILLKTSLNKLCYTLHHVPAYEDKLVAEIVKGHIILKQLCATSEAAELKKDIYDYLLDLSQLSYYPYLSIRYNAISFIFDYFKYKSKELFAIIENQIWRKRENETQRIKLWATHFILVHKTAGKMDIDKKLLTISDKIAKDLLSDQFYTELLAYCEANEFKTNDIHLYHLDSLFVESPKQVTNKASDFFVRTKDLRILDKIKLKFSEEEIQKFISSVDKKIKKDIDPIIYMQYLYRMNKIDVLFDFLETKKDFRYTMIYDSELYKKNPEKLSGLYEEMLEIYLNQHVGEHSHVFIDELFAHLNKIKAVKVVNKLGLLIEMKFPHRTRLNELAK